MKFYCEGDRSKGICKKCKSVVPTTFRAVSLPIESSKRVIEGVLASACDQCGSIVAVPQQSAPRIQEAIFGRKCTVEIRLPKHLRDVLLNVCMEIAGEAGPREIEPFVLRYYIAHIAHNKIRVGALKKHMGSRLFDGKANDRVSFRVSELVLEQFEKKLQLIRMNRTDAIKAIILQAKVDLIDKAAPRRLREIALSASAA